MWKKRVGEENARAERLKVEFGVVTFHCVKLVCFLLPYKIHSTDVSFAQHFDLDETRWTDLDLRV